MDPFEARLQFIKTLQRLNASTSSNDAACQFMLKHDEVQEDLYSCILQELAASSINTRLNIFGFLNSLCENLINKYNDPKNHNYCIWLNRDFVEIIQKTVPEDHDDGLLNLGPTLDLISKTGCFNQLIHADALDAAISFLNKRKQEPMGTAPVQMSREQILRRMDEDRERAKRAKESIWAIDYKANPNYEFDMMWDNLSTLQKLDFEQMQEDNEIAAPGV